MPKDRELKKLNGEDGWVWFSSATMTQSTVCGGNCLVVLVNEANPCGDGDDIANLHVTRFSPRISNVGCLDIATIW